MYDNVCKFLAETFTSDFATWLLGEPISLTQLSPSELSLEPIRADTLILLESEQIVLQVEFQTQPDPNIPFRMLDYRVRLYRRYPDKQVRQVVVYLRETRAELVYQSVFAISGTRHEFEVIRLWEQPTEVFLQLPGLLPFAVLSQVESRAEVLQEVGQRIENLPTRRERSNVMASVSILAGLVLDKELIRRVLRQEIMQESVIYQDLRAEAIAEGRAEGRAEGEAIGIQRGEAAIILRLLKYRLGEINPQLQERIQQLSVAGLEELGEALLSFQSESELVAWLQERF